MGKGKKLTGRLKNIVQNQKAKALRKAGNVLLQKKLAKKTANEKAATALGIINKMPLPQARKAVIDGLEIDIAAGVKEGRDDNSILKFLFEDNPNYSKLINKVELNEEHVKVIIKEQREKLNA